MQVNNWLSFICIMMAIAIGVAIAIMLSDIATVKAGWCDARPACFREWMTALSGWAAFAGAAITIFVLWATLQHMKETDEVRLRAHLYEETVDIVRSADGGPEVLVAIKNYGHTPAHHTKFRAKAWFGLPDDVQPEEVASDLRPIGDVAPTQFFSASLNISEFDTERNKLNLVRRNGNLFVGIAITYSTFGRQSRRIKLFKNAEKGLAEGPMILTLSDDWDGRLDT